MKRQNRWSPGVLRMGAVLVMAATACVPEAAGEADVSEAAEWVAATREWTVASTSGTTVTLAVDAAPIRPGRVRLDIVLGPSPAEVLPLTLDLASPEMPMHGVVRFGAEASDPGRYQAVVDIPMEGYWEVYVNLDYGADAAVFEWEVEPPEGGGGHQHHASPDVSPEAHGPGPEEPRDTSGSHNHAEHQPH